jgi:glycosyltransferase involved in cell wall biosynthesis
MREPDSKSVTKQKRALILTYKTVFNAPRVLKEISWLKELGWTVDTLGLGDLVASNGKHFSIQLPGSMLRYFAYLFLGNRRRFAKLVENRIPTPLAAELPRYDLLIIHDLTLLPWRSLGEAISLPKGPGIWIDLHENHVDSISRNFMEKVAFEYYRRWELRQLKTIVESRRERLILSSVSPWISERFGDFLGREVVTLRNSPPLEHLKPSKTDAKSINLVHHGVGTTHRGIEQAIRVLAELPDNFSLNLMLVASRPYLKKLRSLAQAKKVSHRVRFIDPVPTIGISKRINEFDIALVVNPPITVSEYRAMPNKFFESIQACLGVVVGPNPEMSEIVNKNKNGVVLPDWDDTSLLMALQSLTHEDLSKMKWQSHQLRHALSSETEKQVFSRQLLNLGLL